VTDDELLGLLRGVESAEPPLALGPGAALRRRVAVRRARRQAVGAVLATTMLGGAVIGGLLEANRHRGTPPLAGTGPVGISTALASKSSASAAPAPAPSRGGAMVAPPVTVTSAARSSSHGASQSVVAHTVTATASATGGVSTGSAANLAVTPSTAMVGDPVTAVITAHSGDPRSVLVLASYFGPGQSFTASVVTCSDYRAHGGQPQPDLRKTFTGTYPQAGTYPVRIEVLDICGGAGSRTAEGSVVILDAAGSPSAPPRRVPPLPHRAQHRLRRRPRGTADSAYGP
jgi:hypothetical protein